MARNDLAVCMKICPGPHWRTSYSTDVLCISESDWEIQLTLSSVRGYSSVVEHLTADQEVFGSTPNAPFPCAVVKHSQKQLGQQAFKR